MTYIEREHHWNNEEINPHAYLRQIIINEEAQWHRQYIIYLTNAPPIQYQLESETDTSEDETIEINEQN